jgi:hypothetical protein
MNIIIVNENRFIGKFYGVLCVYYNYKKAGQYIARLFYILFRKIILQI